MDYFLNNPKPQKPLSGQELMALALQNKEKAKAQRKNKEVKGCGCCPVDPPEDTKKYTQKNGQQKEH